jgi:hypothetical protein
MGLYPLQQFPIQPSVIPLKGVDKSDEPIGTLAQFLADGSSDSAHSPSLLPCVQAYGSCQTEYRPDDDADKFV